MKYEYWESRVKVKLRRIVEVPLRALGTFGLVIAVGIVMLWIDFLILLGGKASDFLNDFRNVVSGKT